MFSALLNPQVISPTPLGYGFGVWGLGRRVQGSGFRIWGLGLGLGFGFRSSGFRPAGSDTGAEELRDCLTQCISFEKSQPPHKIVNSWFTISDSR